MNVKFVLAMDSVVVEIHGQKFVFDQLILEWEEEMKEKKVLELTRKYLTSKNFLPQRLVGLSRVGDSSLTIEPAELVSE